LRKKEKFPKARNKVIFFPSISIKIIKNKNDIEEDVVFMKKHTLRNIVIAGVACTVLAVPLISQAVNTWSFPLQNKVVAAVDNKPAHWAQKFLDELSKEYDIEAIFKDKNFNSAINMEDFQNAVRLVIDKEYSGKPDAITREAVVYELVKIWAEKTGQDLNDIAVIQMLIYSDTAEINSKYNHAVTLAYMKNIAKGKGSGIFDPRADVTYGELAALVYNTDKAIKEELNSDTQQISEERFETKGSCKLINDKVLFEFELVNRYNEPKELMFGSGQQFELTIIDEKGEEVYRYSDGKFFTLALVMKTIDPGESLKWQDEWDMTNKNGEKLTSGKYKAEISILAVQEDEDKEIEESQLKTVINFDLDELRQRKDIISPETAEKTIKETADKLIHAISVKDAKTISDYVHPVKGVRFTPYTYVSVEKDVVFSKEKMKNFFEDQNVYLWGYYDGTGDEIKLTPGGYYEKFIYSADFKNAEQIGYNEVLSTGNMLENQFEIYDNPIVVEYYFPGFNPEYEGMDWKSLRLVFEKYEDSWKLVGIIHNQWTI